MSIMHTFRVFPNDPLPPTVARAEGNYIYTTDGTKILDVTAGGTSHAIVGWGHPSVVAAITAQLSRFTHMDYKIWRDEHVEQLASLLVSRAGHGLDRVYFCGNSGAEACEAAMKMSYQVHQDLGRKTRRWFISHTESYHGATSDALALGQRPNLEFYRQMLSPYRALIPMHHPYKLREAGETVDDYARRSAAILEAKILEIGPENVCAYLGETMMGGLIGDVPPAPNYWRYVRAVCDKYDVHLILDEVYCGTGSSGRIYCCDWDDVRPDFVFIGKTLAAGYGAVSAVITSSDIEGVIARVQGRLQHTTTFQAHSLGIAAALAVQTLIHDDDFLAHVVDLGQFMRSTIETELSSHPFFVNVRGRGLRFSFEYACPRQNEFGMALANRILTDHHIFTSIKWHRANFTPSLTLTRAQAEQALDVFIAEFKTQAASWPA
jgi:adenosylmethionine-8-amino-7-oxononanoate aminotransferase